MSRHIEDAPFQYVYRIYDVDGRLIYVGLTHSIADRMLSHRSKWWWAQVADFGVVKFHDLRMAQVAEIDAIASELPRWNIEHKIKGLDHWTAADARDFETAMWGYYTDAGYRRDRDDYSITEHRHFRVMKLRRPDLFQAAV
jgi:predicted GIY-YIG superfamily endonuclease